MLEVWQQLASTKPFYAAAVESWSQRDVRKFKTLQNNGLNYLVIYNNTVSTNLEEAQWNKLIIR